MKKGFDFIPSRKWDDRIEINHLENQYQLTFPPIFRLFLAHFELKNENFKKESIQISNEPGLVVPLESIVYAPTRNDPNPINPWEFYDIEEILKDHESTWRKEKEWLKYGLLRIGRTSEDIGIYLGMRNDNLDQIWRVAWDWGNNETHVKLTENVFEFVRGFESKVLSRYAQDVADGKISKAFNDKYWKY